jgi:hypothetical protein
MADPDRRLITSAISNRMKFDARENPVAAKIYESSFHFFASLDIIQATTIIS